MGSVKKAFKKVVGAVTGKSSSKAPKIEVAAPEIQYAPEVENPEENTPEVLKKLKSNVEEKVKEDFGSTLILLRVDQEVDLILSRRYF